MSCADTKVTAARAEKATAYFMLIYFFGGGGDEFFLGNVKLEAGFEKIKVGKLIKILIV